MTFAPELIRVLVGVSPFDVRLLVLPGPRLGEHDIALADPGAVLHAAGDPTESRLAVYTTQADVISAEVLRHYSKHFVVRGHSEVPTPGFFAHTVSNALARISDLRRVSAFHA